MFEFAWLEAFDGFIAKLKVARRASRANGEEWMGRNGLYWGDEEGAASIFSWSARLAEGGQCLRVGCLVRLIDCETRDDVDAI